MSGSAGYTIGHLPVLAFPPAVASAVLVIYVTCLLVKRFAYNHGNGVEYARTVLLDKRLKKILQNLPSSIDETEAQKSGCLPCVKKRNTEGVPTTSPLSTLNGSGEDEDADEVLRRKLRVTTVVKELQDIIRLLARILTRRREVSQWKIPLLRLKERDYLLSLISPDSSLESTKRKHLVSVPLSIAHIQKKLREGRDELANIAGRSEGGQLAIAAQLERPRLAIAAQLEGHQSSIAAQLEEARVAIAAQLEGHQSAIAAQLQGAQLEGAQLAIVYKAIQVVQAEIVTQLNISLQILKITAYAILTLLSFYYIDFQSENTNAIFFLLLNVAADTISNVSTTSLVDFMTPRLSAGMNNLVREIELHLKRKALNKEPEVNDWLNTYFDEYYMIQKLVRDDYSAYRGSTIERAGNQLLNCVSYN